MKRFALIAIVAAALPAAAFAQYVSDAEPFINAVSGRDGDKAIQLIGSHPSVVNMRNLKGQTALNVAIARSDDTWMRFLLGKGADPNLADGKGDTPLITAARVGFTDAAEVLLALGAKVDETNRMGETALIVAVQQRQLPLVKLLLARGANPDKADAAAGYSARDYAKRDTRNREILQAIEEGGKQPKKPEIQLDDFKLK